MNAYEVKHRVGQMVRLLVQQETTIGIGIKFIIHRSWEKNLEHFERPQRDVETQCRQQGRTPGAHTFIKVHL